MATSPLVVFFSPSGNQGPNREDLLDTIFLIDPTDTPLLTRAPKTVARHVLHEWLQDALAAVSTTGAVEGADFSGATLTAPSREFNWTWIPRKDFAVTMSERAVNAAGMRDAYGHQAWKAMQEVTRNAEAKLFANDATASATSGAREMRTLEHFITDNAFNANSAQLGGSGAGTAVIITETVFNGILEEIYTDGGKPDSVYVGSKAKRQISAFTVNNNVRRNIAMADRRLDNAIDVYLSDFGMISIILDRFVPQGTTASATTNSAGRAFFLESAMVRVAFLRPVGHMPLAPAGDAARGIVLGELSLEVGQQKACGKLTDVLGRVTNN